MKRFTVTEDHLKLLRRAYVGWESSEFGAPAIDCKRPYGNGDVVRDIVKILGWPTVATDDGDSLPPGTSDRAAKIHAETQTAFQIALATGSFKAGVYEQQNYRTWKLVS